ncbi:MAG: hypothetical protein BWY25_02340 [Chloroflexi bacterium ADurb.Bin222]|nr:MAG: hypothetical protein BWY25_02340 [Chloroflexi bacterium ADurb.Bin222]
MVAGSVPRIAVIQQVRLPPPSRRKRHHGENGCLSASLAVRHRYDVALQDGVDERLITPRRVAVGVIMTEVRAHHEKIIGFQHRVQNARDHFGIHIPKQQGDDRHARAHALQERQLHFEAVLIMMGLTQRLKPRVTFQQLLHRRDIHRHHAERRRQAIVVAHRHALEPDAMRRPQQIDPRGRSWPFRHGAIGKRGDRPRIGIAGMGDDHRTDRGERGRRRRCQKSVHGLLQD